MVKPGTGLCCAKCAKCTKPIEGEHHKLGLYTYGDCCVLKATERQKSKQ